MLFEIQRACPRPGQSRVIASGPSAIKTLAALTSLRPNAKINVIPPVTEKVEFGSMPDLRGPVPEIEPDENIQEMVENGEHTCHMFDAPCQTCEDDEDEDDITLAELKEQLEDNMTLAELQDRLLEEEEEEEEEPIKFVDEMTFYSRSSEHLPNF
jgi:hypothetical protein